MSEGISVVIPAYGHAGYIDQTLASVMAQTIKPVEVIVVNDGSPDDTEERLHKYIEGRQIRYFKQENQGQAAARNRGISEARGKYIALLDDDDIWPVEKLEWQVRVLEEMPDAGAVFGYYATLGDHAAAPVFNVEDRQYHQRDFIRENAILSPGQALFRKDALIAVGGFDEKLWGADDWDLYLRLLPKTRIIGRARHALSYRWHATNASRNFARMRINELTVLHRHFGLSNGIKGLADWCRIRKRFARHYANLFAENGCLRTSILEGMVFSVLDRFRDFSVLKGCLRKRTVCRNGNQ